MLRDGTLLRDDGDRKTRRPAPAGRPARERLARGHPPLRRGAHTPEGSREANYGRGYVVGERPMVFVFEADSEEVRKVLKGLPLWGRYGAWSRPRSGECVRWENCRPSRSSSGALAR